MKKIPLIIESLKNKTLKFENLSFGYQVSEPIARVAVELNGLHLGLLADKQRSDKKLAMIAVRSHPNAYTYIMGSLKKDIEIVNLIIDHNINSLATLIEISVNFQDDNIVIEKIIKKIKSIFSTDSIDPKKLSKYMADVYFNIKLQDIILLKIRELILSNTEIMNDKKYSHLTKRLLDDKFLENKTQAVYAIESILFTNS
jgi:hypothetical protein